MEPVLSRPDEVRVLHVDDEPDFLELVATYVEREDDDIEVVTESDATAAVERLREERVDCVVSDFEMPEVDGLDLLERVREYDEDLPFVLFTGKGSEEIAADAIEAGVDAYLTKGTDPSQYVVLAQRVRSQVDRHWEHRRAEKALEVYELLAQVSTDAFWIRDMTTGETLYSDGIRQFGYEPGVREDGFDWWLERVHPDDRPDSRQVNEAQEAADPSGFSDFGEEYGEFTHRYRWRCADGSYIDCRSRGVVRFEDGQGVEMVGAMTDLSGIDDE